MSSSAHAKLAQTAARVASKRGPDAAGEQPPAKRRRKSAMAVAAIEIRRWQSSPDPKLLRRPTSKLIRYIAACLRRDAGLDEDVRFEREALAAAQTALEVHLVACFAAANEVRLRMGLRGVAPIHFIDPKDKDNAATVAYAQGL